MIKFIIYDAQVMISKLFIYTGWAAGEHVYPNRLSLFMFMIYDAQVMISRVLVGLIRLGLLCLFMIYDAQFIISRIIVYAGWVFRGRVSINSLQQILAYQCDH